MSTMMRAPEEDLMATASQPDYDWDPFLGRALAYLCLHFADLSTKPVLEQADFLMRLGLRRKDAAAVLGSTDESLRVLANQRAKRVTANATTI
jgi:hypothetical protein